MHPGVTAKALRRAFEKDELKLNEIRYVILRDTDYNTVCREGVLSLDRTEEKKKQQTWK